MGVISVKDVDCGKDVPEVVRNIRKTNRWTVRSLQVCLGSRLVPSCDQTSLDSGPYSVSKTSSSHSVLAIRSLAWPRRVRPRSEPAVAEQDVPDSQVFLVILYHLDRYLPHIV